MHYNDKIYGHFNITEPVILELLKCPALKRLKDIDQGGYGPLFAKPYKRVGQFGHNRFAHSIGVFLLLKKYGAPLEEQIAGLIHDVSHSAFSHCIDYVVDGGDGKEQNHQDNLFKKYLKTTAIPKILKRHGFSLNYIINDKNFPLKEKQLPDLCADRIDYSLRTAIIFKEKTPSQIKSILNDLQVKKGKWIFKNRKSAKLYAKLFYKLNKVHYAGVDSAIMFLAVGDCLKYALDKKYITKTDLYKNDKIVLEKIKKYLNKDKKLKLFWLRMNGKIKIKQSFKNYDAEIFCKSRIIDPLFINKQKINPHTKFSVGIKRLSAAEFNWRKIVKQELKPKQYFLKYNY